MSAPNDEKTVTEREAVMREREAFQRAIRDQYKDYTVWLRGDKEAWGTLENEARKRYPLPPRTEPNVQTDSEGFAWRCIGGRLWAREGQHGEWYAPNTLHDIAVPGRLSSIALVISNPTVEVPECD